MSEIITTKEKNISEDIQFLNESHILMNSKPQIIKNNDILNKEEEINDSLKKESNIVTKNKKVLEQIERRKLLEEYKRKKQEKKEKISSKIKLKKTNFSVNHDKNISKRENLNNKLKLNLKSQSIEIKKEIIELKKVSEPTVKDSIKHVEDDKIKTLKLKKSVKKEIDISNKDSHATDVTVIYEKPIKIEKKSNKKDRDNKEKNCNNTNVKKKIDLKNEKSSSKLTNTNSNLAFKESGSLTSTRNTAIKHDKNLKDNISVTSQSSKINKKEELLNSNKALSSENLLKSKSSKPKISSTNKKVSLEKHTTLTPEYIAKSSPKIKSTNNYTNNKTISQNKLISSPSYLPSTPKTKTKILNSPLISSPVSSPITESEFKKQKIKPLLRNASPISSKKLNNVLQNSLLHTPSNLSIKSFAKVSANKSFCVANNFNKRTRSFQNSDNKSFIDHEQHLVKRVKRNSNKEENTQNKNNKILNLKILSNNIKEESSKNNYFSIGTNEAKNIKINNNPEASNYNSNFEKKKIGSCPHYLMPTANWKTKVVKHLQINDKKINKLKSSPISKIKTTLKILNSSKSIKKKVNNTIINNGPITKTNADTNKLVLTSTIATTNTGSKLFLYHLYNPKDIKHNLIDSKYLITSINNKSKILSNHSGNKASTPNTIQESKKEKINKRILTRSATLPISTPSKRINKNIKRNNIAFTEENEQDINRMFISAETLKSSSIDSFFSHYNNTDNEKKDQYRS